MHRWKINMNNGDKFIIRNEMSDARKFMELILGHGNQGITVTHLQLDSDLIYKYGNDFKHSYNSNYVSIISSNVSSVEYCHQ